MPLGALNVPSSLKLADATFVVVKVVSL